MDTDLPAAVILFGAGGFIGGNIAAALSGKVGRLIGVNRSGRPVPGCDRTVAIGHLREIEALPPETVVINVAADRYHPRTFSSQQAAIWQRNVEIVTTVYGFCVERGIKEVRQASSSAVYVAGADPLDDSRLVDLNVQPNAGEIGYAWSRRIAEIAADLHRQMAGIHTQSFRLTNPFGLYDTLDDQGAHVATALVIRALRENGPLRLYGNPDARRDFVYAGDVARIFVESCRETGRHTALNLARGETTSIREFAAEVLKATGRDRPIEVSNDLPPGVNIRRATNGLLHQHFPGFAMLSLAEGIAATVEWYRDALRQ